LAQRGNDIDRFGKYLWQVPVSSHWATQICPNLSSVATAIAGVFANFTNKIDKMTEKLEDVDKAKSRGVSCQH